MDFPYFPFDKIFNNLKKLKMRIEKLGSMKDVEKLQVYSTDVKQNIIRFSFFGSNKPTDKPSPTDSLRDIWYLVKMDSVKPEMMNENQRNKLCDLWISSLFNIIFMFS